MAMDLPRPATLRYIPQHRVLLCTTCEFCVLPQALDRHLKDIHRLPRAERRLNCQAFSELALASLEDITYPSPDESPIPGLPRLHGYTCTAVNCKHSCVTLKRMQAHWTAIHGVPPCESSAAICYRPVVLQTFFRGKALRYFIVSAGSRKSSSSDISLPVETKPILLQAPCSPNINETAIDWLLTEQFAGLTWRAVRPVKATSSVWKDQILQRCLSEDFLRYALLSVTACQVASQYPASRALYTDEADRYRYMAIAALPSYSIDDEVCNFFTFFNFFRLFGTCFMAREQLSILAQHDMEDLRPVLPEWVMISRRGRALWFRHRGKGRIVHAMQGPSQELANVWMMSEEDTVLNPHDEWLRELAMVLQALPHHTTDPICLEALQMLRRVWAVPYRSSASGFRDMTLMWIARVPDHFLALVERHEPVALVVFAHWCVLWNLSEAHCWYMQYQAQSMLVRVIQHIDQDWQDCIAWPISMLSSPKMSESSIVSPRETYDAA